MRSVQQADITPPIERQSLQEIIAGRVRDMIIEGHLGQGEPVNESRLCLDLGVSRTPMREAIHTLAAEGLVVLRPGRSSIVRAFSPEEVRDMLDVIGELEALAGRKACENAGDDEIAEISLIHGQMITHYKAGERLAYYKLNQQIHSRIVAAAANGALSEMHGLLQSRMKRIRFVGHNAPENWQGAVGEHEEMIAALKARDGEKLAEVLKRHITNTWDRVSTSL